VKKLKLVKRGKNYLPLILREIQIVATSTHPNIVAYIESFHVEDELWVWGEGRKRREGTSKREKGQRKEGERKGKKGRRREVEDGSSSTQVVMEYMSGGSLYQIVELYPRGVKFSESLAAYVIHELLEAVAFLHGLKRIHRDIKGKEMRMCGEGRSE
jgi:serine/threonine protein kinase